MTAIGPGTRVKCITDFRLVDSYPNPEIGKIYRVSAIVPSRSFPQGEPLLSFSEFPDSAYDPIFFRPLDGDAEIERLRAILTKPADPDLAKKRELIVETAG